MLFGEATDINPFGRLAIKLLLLSGCRRSEILTLKWAHVDWEHYCFYLSDSKTGSKTVPVGLAVMRLLKDVPRINDSPFVLPATRGAGHYVGIQKDWTKIRHRTNLNDVRLHDLRRTFASTAAIQGQSLLTIGKLLGHTDPKTTSIYAHLTDQAVRNAAENAAHKLADLLKSNDSDD